LADFQNFCTVARLHMGLHTRASIPFALLVRLWFVGISERWKGHLVWRFIMCAILARVNEGSRRFTCHPDFIHKAQSCNCS